MLGCVRPLWKVLLSTMSPERLQRIVREEVARAVRSWIPGTRFRRCLHCNKPFRLRRDIQAYCSKACCRRAHYLSFNVRAIRRHQETP